MLMRKDRASKILFTDIAEPTFNAAAYGTTYSDLMARIRGRLPDGSWIEGVEVFRRLYKAIGWGWIVAITRVPGISHLLALGYRAFAANRLRLTGRCVPNGSCAIPEKRRAGTSASPAN